MSFGADWSLRRGWLAAASAGGSARGGEKWSGCPRRRLPGLPAEPLGQSVKAEVGRDLGFREEDLRGSCRAEVVCGPEERFL